ncbi:hypothetical protein LINPERHAP2_LOCUS461 [Linum perenne]
MHSIFAWNCQGAAHRSFVSSFKSYLNKFCFPITVIVESKISHSRADVVIRKLGFDSFFRAEAVGFKGGVWCVGTLMLSPSLFLPMIINSFMLKAPIAMGQSFSSQPFTQVRGRRRELFFGTS